MNEKFFYLVEGECEKKIIEEFKGIKLKSGKIKKLDMKRNNVINNNFLRTIKDNTTIIIIFDLDIFKNNFNDLEVSNIINNVKKLLDSNYRVIFINQNDNFEDEIIKATNLRNIISMFDSFSVNDFKKDFVECTNLGIKLVDIEFNFNSFWQNNDDFLIKYLKKNLERHLKNKKLLFVYDRIKI